MIDWDNPLQVPFNTPQPLHSPPKREIYNFKKLKEFTLEPMFMGGCGQLSLDTLLTLDIRLLSTVLFSAFQFTLRLYVFVHAFGLMCLFIIFFENNLSFDDINQNLKVQT